MTTQFVRYSRDGVVAPASKYEKLVMLPALSEKDPCVHAYADACFAVDIMAEHALFFVMLMPPELVQAERSQAQQFQSTFTNLLKKLEANGVPKPDGLKAFCQTVIDAIKPFIDYKQKALDATLSGSLRSLVWPLFFQHTLDEAVRWSARLTQLSSAQSEYNRQDTATFWTKIIEEHAQFEAHLLDPQEQVQIATCLAHSKILHDLHAACMGPSGCPVVVGTADPVLQAAKDVLKIDTDEVRAIEAVTVRSIIDPRLGDHFRRETLKFVDEMQRAM